MNGNNGGFFVQPAQYDFSMGGGSGGDGGADLLQGLQGMFGQQSQPNGFASQTPGAPMQPGRIDQSSFSGQMPQGGGSDMDPMAMLMQNIAKRFAGGM